MTTERTGLHGLPEAFDSHGSSFFAHLQRAVPDAVPMVLRSDTEHGRHVMADVVEGTTVLALNYAGGVLIAGDRRATAGNIISKKDMRKVFPADTYSAIAISGAAGPAMEMARVFATELEHYEKVEGDRLTLEGKANKLAAMVRANLPMAMQGLVVVPLFAGVDDRTGVGSIFEYDPAGGRYLATDFSATGSGGLMARGALKRLHEPSMDADAGARLAVAALFDAADDDSATGGPDAVRGIYPIVALIDLDGYRELSDNEVMSHVASITAEAIDRRN